MSVDTLSDVHDLKEIESALDQFYAAIVASIISTISQPGRPPSVRQPFLLHACRSSADADFHRSPACIWIQSLSWRCASDTQALSRSKFDLKFHLHRCGRAAKAGTVAVLPSARSVHE